MPVGTIGRRKRWARPHFHVLESGGGNAGKWRVATIDLGQSYDSSYGGRPQNRTEGIGLLSDANSTHSVATASYGEIRAWKREAVSDSLLQRQCACLAKIAPD